MINSINKGKGFEREVVKLLEKATPQQKYCRIPQSGATATNWNLSNLCGDVLPLEVLNGDSKQAFVIECKATANSIEIQDLFNEKSKLYSFLKQTMKEAEQVNTIEWYLFVKIDRKGTYVISPFQFPLYNLIEGKEIIITLSSGRVLYIKKVI